MSKYFEYDDWVYKCLSCIHCYRRKDDDETMYCRCKKGCNYETNKKTKKKNKSKEK